MNLMSQAQAITSMLKNERKDNRAIKVSKSKTFKAITEVHKVLKEPPYTRSVLMGKDFEKCSEASKESPWINPKAR